MRIVLIISTLLLSGCDGTDKEAPSTPNSISSPFVTVQATSEPLQVASPTTPDESTGGSTTTPDNSQTPITDPNGGSGNGESGNQEANEPFSNPSNVPTTPVTSTPTSPGASPTSPTNTPVQPTTPPQAQSPANRLFQQLRNGRYTYDQETFWACSTQNENAAFRIQMTSQERDNDFDVTTVPWSAAAVRIDSIADTYDFTARDWINW